MAQLVRGGSLCWFSHFDNNYDDAKNNDTSHDKRSQHLPSASGLTGTFLNAIKHGCT